MSYQPIIHNNQLTDIIKFSKENKWVNLRWEFLNGEPCVVLEYIPIKNINQEDSCNYKFDVWPNNPYYYPMWNLNYLKPDFIKQAYEFLNDKVYVGHI